MESKPFPCKIEGCDRSFVTEDHLTVHRKKHDLVLKGLSLEFSKANVFADQTPTPTRLIKNCDEVGLFEDLRNVNPFEEIFKRAIDEKTSTVSNIELKDKTRDVSIHLVDLLNPEPSSDTLHTPHIFPHYHSDGKRMENDATLGEGKNKDKRLQNNKTLKNCLDKRKNVSEKSQLDDSKSSEKTLNAGHKLNESQGNNESEKRTIIFPECQVSLNKRNYSVKKKIQSNLPAKTPKVLPILPKPVMKQHIILQCISNDNVILSDIHSITPAHNSLKDNVRGKLKELLCKKRVGSDTSSTIPQKIQVLEPTNSVQESNGKSKIAETASNQQKPRDEHIFERNREAAKRYRHKIKLKQNSLEKRNRELENENCKLKRELLQLKKILATHSNCSLNKVVTTGANLNHQSQEILKNT